MRNRRGVMRIIEALVACGLVLIAHYFLSFSSSSINKVESAELESLGQNLLNTLENQDLLMTVMYDEQNWNSSIRAIIESILPPDILFNISLVSLESGQVLTPGGITNMGTEEPPPLSDSVSGSGVYTFSYPLLQKREVLLDIMMIMDSSESMDSKLPHDTHTKIYYTRIAARNFIGRLNSTTDRAGMVSFQDTPSLKIGLTSNFYLVNQSINNLTANGYTNMGGGFRVTNSHIESYARDNATKVVILLSDGVANVYEDESFHHVHDSIPYNVAKEYALNRSQETKDMNTRIYTIGLGDRNSTDWNKKIDEALLKQIQTDGYFYAPSAEDLDRIYQAIAEDLINEVKYDVILIQITLMKPL